MKVIDSKVEIIPQGKGLDGVYKQIEIGGRTAYKSEDKITSDSSKAFVDMLINRGHTAPLEQGTIYLYMPWLGATKYILNPYCIVNIIRGLGEKVLPMEYGGAGTYVTTNARVIYENGWEEDLKYLCEPTKYHEKRITVRFTCSRSISHELVRHRVFSFVQESTRYCNYSKSKFGQQLTFIKPSCVDIPLGEYTDLQYEPDFDLTTILLDGVRYSFRETPFKEDRAINPKYFNFIEPLYYSELNYLIGLDKGFRPQEMREILPNALKTEVIMTGFISDWDGFFKLRCDTAAHPDMRKLANELKELMSNAAFN